MRVLGVDPGTAACGYGVVLSEEGLIRALDHGWWKTPAGQTPEARAERIRDEVVQLVRRYGLEAVAVEASHLDADAGAARLIGQARGAVLAACADAEVPCSEYTPAAVKQILCGHARADRAQLRRMVSAVLGLRELTTSHHAPDALAVAVCHALAASGAPLAEAAR